MSQNTLDNYLSPNTRLKDSKRRRSNNSPGEDDKKKSKIMGTADSNVCPAWANDIKLMVCSLNDTVSKLATKEDFNKLEEKLQSTISKYESTKEEINSLRVENKQLKEKLEILENYSRRNNLIFRGVPESDDMEQAIRNICSQLLGIQENLNLVQAFTMGRLKENGGSKCTVFVEFATHKYVQLIMSKILKIRDTGIYIHQDFAPETRIRRSKLLALRREIKKASSEARVRLRVDTMTVTNGNGKTINLKWNEEYGLTTTDGEDGRLALTELFGANVTHLVTEVALQKAGDQERRKDS